MPKVAQGLKDEFGAAVRKARALKGWAVKDLLAATGRSSQSFISGVENGKRELSATTVGLLIKTLDMEKAWYDKLIDPDAGAEDEVTQEDKATDALLYQSEKTGATDKLAALGITENAIIELAQRAAADTTDLEQAWTELQNAMEIAVRVQESGRTTSNHPDFVDQVIAEGTQKAAEGEYSQARVALKNAREATEAQALRLTDQEVDIALLNDDVENAAALLVRKADLDAGGSAEFEDLRRLQKEKYVSGRDKGINLDLELSIALAELNSARSTPPDQAGTALNDLGTALLTLGQRESGTERLETAVAAYEAALEERTRDRVPLDWAMTQHCISCVELAYFDKKGQKAHLDRAKAHALAAQEGYVEVGAQHYIDWIARLIVAIESQRDRPVAPLTI